MTCSKNRILCCAFVLAVFCFAPSIANADTLVPNGSHIFPAYTPNTPGHNPTGPAIATIGGSFLNGHFGGTYTESVYNTASGNKDYVFQFDITSVSSGNSPDAVVLQGFGLTGLDFFTMGSGLDPHSVTENTNGSIQMLWNIGPRLTAGTNTSYLVFSTNSPWGETSISDIQNGAVQPFQDLAPAPEPSTMLLFGTGLSGLAVMLRRRKTLFSF